MVYSRVNYENNKKEEMEKIMIYLDLKGRLGNQLFEYAFVRMIQEQTKQKILISTYGIEEDNCDTYPISEELSNFKLNDNIEFYSKKVPWYMNEKNLISKMLRKIDDKKYYNFFKRRNVLVWYRASYIETNIENKDCDIFVSGYWQSSKYFDSIRNILLEELQPRYPLIEKNKMLYNKIKTTESVCITIRRGDYVTNPKFKLVHYVCDERYFTKAINKIKKIIPGCTFFIFSDDIEWCKNNLSFDNECYYESGDDPVWEKLRLMSACKHFILSNSSFSWWAQYLCKNDNKVIVAPSKWYNDSTRADIYEKSWELIEV